MPELPEVETTRRGIAPPLLGRTVSQVIVRQPRLRYPVDAGLPGLLQGLRLEKVDRRAKYLLLDFAQGALLLHLGMSGSLRVLPATTLPEKHDHLDLVFDEVALRLRDPRRFGAALWVPGQVDAHPLLARLGPEPLSDAFDGAWLYAASRGRNTPIKLFIMDAAQVVGVGNIYASESLFRAAILPRTPAGRLSRPRCERLASAIKETLTDALAAGGSSLRDFLHSDGKPGYFQQQYAVYGRDGLPCPRCGGVVQRSVMGQRATFYCPGCQKP
ncbi:bifunctional DNA-formamidopyrimidine glycosylase/DNA-(apurinic or apyrimidinic site) lyase [Uliginosibacterium sp. H1]|uniref:bifunctional DNA-formamidopyrimidine glycosylase/DNA-(apurinic or apyrimidinic site) lyase n=1 Tax=Uliginosibacterium sp. H1 TaxID=3114757 RepID=UPI002E185398|nr:bifunctional DNA-formamidopyrimidine glycosylase/DNA-(apurinic or apyrimidinic site) lyase [Uliginosibacterium sp. H1]